MNFLNHPFFGFGTTPQELFSIIHHCGYFFGLVAFGYAVAYTLYRRQSEEIRKSRMRHVVSIGLWALVSFDLLFDKPPKAFFLFLILLYAMVAYFSLLINIPYRIAVIMKPIDLTYINYFSRWYFKYVQKKIAGSEYQSAIYENSLINEHILWILILYHVAVAIRATMLLKGML